MKYLEREHVWLFGALGKTTDAVALFSAFWPLLLLTMIRLHLLIRNTVALRQDKFIWKLLGYPVQWGIITDISDELTFFALIDLCFLHQQCIIDTVFPGLRNLFSEYYDTNKVEKDGQRNENKKLLRICFYYSYF